jgi:MoxR-like ATPase
MVAMTQSAVSFRAAVDDGIEMLPTPAHRAFFRLLLDAIAGRHHRRNEEPSGWPSFIAVGPTKSGKSLLAAGACRVFAIDAATTIRSAPAETERSLWGRRHQLPGGAWALRPSPVLARPLLVLDEVDKAPRDVQRSSLKLLQGEARVPGEEDELVEVAPTVLILANGGVDIVPPEYHRRSIVLDVAPLGKQVTELYRVAQRFLETLPVIDLDSLEVVQEPLPDGITNELAAALRAGLSEEGWRMADERALAHLVAGRAALTGLDLRAAALAVVADYLDVAATVNEVASAPGPMEPAPDAAARRQAASEQAAREREERRRARAEDVELAGVIGQVVDKLRLLRPNPASIATHRRVEAARVASQLDTVIAMASEATSLDELHEVIEDQEAVISAAQALGSALSVGQLIEVAPEAARWHCLECGGSFDVDELDYLESSDTHRCPVCGCVDDFELLDDEEVDAPALPATRALPPGPTWVDMLRGIGVGLAATRTAVPCSMCHTGTASCILDGCPMPAASPGQPWPTPAWR